MLGCGAILQEPEIGNGAQLRIHQSLRFRRLLGRQRPARQQLLLCETEGQSGQCGAGCTERLATGDLLHEVLQSAQQCVQA